jgi:hypothetical protein
MKKKIGILTVLAIFLSLTFITCKKDKEEFSAEDAKVELRSANQEVQSNMGEIMVHPSAESMTFLMGLMDMDDDEWKSSLKSTAIDEGRIKLMAVNKFIRESIELKLDEIDPEEGGEYTFNFNTDEFDLTDPDVDYLQLIYPANDLAYQNQQLNAELTLSDIEFVEIEYTDEWGTYYEDVLTSAIVTHKIDNQVVMTCDYQSTINDEGMPLSVSFNMDMSPYTFSLTQTGSGLNYTSTMMFKENNNELMSYDLDIKYTANQEDVDEISGNYQVTPIRFEGDINAAAMDNCQDTDIDCLNNNMDVEVIQTDENKIIGHLEFRMYYDADWDEEYPEMVIVYADGSWEYLFIVLGNDFGDFKFGMMR